MCGSASLRYVFLWQRWIDREVDPKASDKCRLPTSIDYRATPRNGTQIPGELIRSSYPRPVCKASVNSSCAIAPPMPLRGSVAAAVELADKRIKTARLAMAGWLINPGGLRKRSRFSLAKLRIPKRLSRQQ